MQSPSRETTIRYKDAEGEDQVITLRFSNSGLREAEAFLGESGDMLRQRVGSMNISDRIESALLWGGSRRYHAREIRDESDLDDLMDAIKDHYEELDDEDAVIDGYYAPLIASYMRTPQASIAALMKGEEPPEDVGGSRSQRRKNGKGKKANAGPTKVESEEKEAS